MSWNIRNSSPNPSWAIPPLAEVGWASLKKEFINSCFGGKKLSRNPDSCPIQHINHHRGEAFSHRATPSQPGKVNRAIRIPRKLCIKTSFSQAVTHGQSAGGLLCICKHETLFLYRDVWVNLWGELLTDCRVSFLFFIPRNVLFGWIISNIFFSKKKKTVSFVILKKAVFYSKLPLGVTRPFRQYRDFSRLHTRNPFGVKEFLLTSWRVAAAALELKPRPSSHFANRYSAAKSNPKNTDVGLDLWFLSASDKWLPHRNIPKNTSDHSHHFFTIAAETVQEQKVSSDNMMGPNWSVISC